MSFLFCFTIVEIIGHREELNETTESNHSTMQADVIASPLAGSSTSLLILICATVGGFGDASVLLIIAWRLCHTRHQRAAFIALLLSPIASHGPQINADKGATVGVVVARQHQCAFQCHTSSQQQQPQQQQLQLSLLDPAQALAVANNVDDDGCAGSDGLSSPALEPNLPNTPRPRTQGHAHGNAFRGENRPRPPR